MKELVELHTFEGQLVFNPFMGSGSTGVACKELNRGFIGCELNKDFCNKAKERIENA